jgi:hypothetical protein
VKLTCPACKTNPRRPGQYLCPGCWGQLSDRARRSLNRRDRLALARLRELHQELEAGTPLHQIEVGP